MGQLQLDDLHVKADGFTVTYLDEHPVIKKRVVQKITKLSNEERNIKIINEKDAKANELFKVVLNPTQVWNAVKEEMEDIPPSISIHHMVEESYHINPFHSNLSKLSKLPTIPEKPKKTESRKESLDADLELDFLKDLEELKKFTTKELDNKINRNKLKAIYTKVIEAYQNVDKPILCLKAFLQIKALSNKLAKPLFKEPLIKGPGQILSNKSWDRYNDFKKHIKDCAKKSYLKEAALSPDIDLLLEQIENIPTKKINDKDTKTFFDTILTSLEEKDSKFSLGIIATLLDIKKISDQMKEPIQIPILSANPQQNGKIYSYHA